MIDFGRLEQLAELHRQGVLSDAEFAQEKGRLLSSVRAAPAAPRKIPPVAIVTIVCAMIIAAATLVWFTFRDRSVASPRPDPRSVMAWPPSPTPTSSPPSPEPSVSPTAAATGGVVHEGNCHMGECSWSRELKRETIGAGVSGRLIRLNLLGGTSDDHGSAIVWNRVPHDVYVFCSLALPAVMMETEREWQVDVLDFVTPTAIPDVLMTSASLYGDACHAGDRQFPDDAEALGYRPIPEERTRPVIAKPRDIFDRVDF